MQDLTAIRPLFRAFVSTVVPEASDLSASEWSAVESLVTAALRLRPPGMQRRVLLFFRALPWAARLRYGRGFVALPPRQRARLLEWLQDHPVQRLRAGFWGVRTLALLGYYGRPQAAAALGYVPDASGWEAAR